jgi:hypothetical protein
MIRKNWAILLLLIQHPNSPGPIDGILGADVYYLIVKEGIQKGNPTAINSELGWLLTGPVQTPTKQKCLSNGVIHRAERSSQAILRPARNLRSRTIGGRHIM